MPRPDELTRRIAQRHERMSRAGSFKLGLLATILIGSLIALIVTLLRS